MQQCKETFNLYYYEANGDYANDKFPTWDTDTYTLIDKVAADYMWEKTTDNNIVINVERRSVTLNPNIRGVYFAVQDEGACVSLMSVRVFYVTCPALTVNFAFFKEVPAGSAEGGVQEYNGVCVPNSVEKTPPTHLCQTSGQWYRDSKGECVCMPGHEGDSERKQCTREWSLVLFAELGRAWLRAWGRARNLISGKKMDRLSDCKKSGG